MQNNPNFAWIFRTWMFFCRCLTNKGLFFWTCHCLSRLFSVSFFLNSEFNSVDVLVACQRSPLRWKNYRQWHGPKLYIAYGVLVIYSFPVGPIGDHEWTIHKSLTYYTSLGHCELQRTSKLFGAASRSSENIQESIVHLVEPSRFLTIHSVHLEWYLSLRKQRAVCYKSGHNRWFPSSQATLPHQSSTWKISENFWSLKPIANCLNIYVP